MLPRWYSRLARRERSVREAIAFYISNFTRKVHEGIASGESIGTDDFKRGDVKGESKYQPLLEYLRRSNQSEVTLSFTQVELLINDILPDSARSKRAWWSNRSKGALQASAWMEAGYLVEKLDLDEEYVTFRKRSGYTVRRVDDTLQWNGELIKAMRLHLGFTQEQLAEELGVRQQTVSEWENGVYAPTRATSKHLALVAEQAGFKYGGG